MLENPLDVLEQFPVRRKNKQKNAFREAVQAYATQRGYHYTTEKGSFDSKNLVLGNPETAKYLVTAHYDTPSRMVFPNFITPCNAVAYICYQVVVVLGMLLISGLPGLLAGYLSGKFQLGYLVWYFSYLGLLALMFFGPANPSNANDNTSGVVTLLSLVEAMPMEHREEVCFVLFDLEEMGLIGSKSYRNTHKAATEKQIVLNLDCVGDGNVMMAFPTKKLRVDADKMALIQKMSYGDDLKKVGVHEKGFYVYPSDQRNFPYGVGIAAFKTNKHIGLYCDRIHTRRDTVLDKRNVNILRDRLLAVITG